MVKGKIVLIPFPFDDFSSTKVRPVLCLTDYIGENNHIVVAFITSKIKDPLLKTDLIIDTTSIGFKDSGLFVSSTVQMHRLMTISDSIIKRELGVLSKDLFSKAIEKLRLIFTSHL